MKKNSLVMAYLFIALVTHAENNSKINIKTNIKKSVIESFIEKEVPTNFNGDEKISLSPKSGNNLFNVGLSILKSIKPKYSPNVILNYNINREKIFFILKNWNLSSQTNFNGRVVGNLDGSSEKFITDFKGSLGVNSFIDLSENWELTTKTSPVLNLEKVILPIKVNVSGFKINEDISLKNQVSNKINPILNKAAIDIDNKIKEINLKAAIENYWQGLNTPILLDSKSDVWLVVRPKKAYRGNLSSDDEKISLNSGLEGELTIFVGKPESITNLGILPKLQSTSQDLSKFDLNIPIIIKYEKLQDLIDQNLSNEIFNLFKGAKLQIKKVTLEGDNKLLKIRNSFSINLFSLFNLEGTMIARGTPEIEENRVFKAKDFSFEIESESIILKFLDKFFHNKIQNILIKNYLTLDFQNDLAGARKILEEKTAKFQLKENIFIENSIEELKVMNVEIKEKEIIIYANMLGSSNLEINSF